MTTPLSDLDVGSLSAEGDGSTNNPVAIPFQYEDVSEVKAYIRDCTVTPEITALTVYPVSGGGVDTPLTNPTHFSISGANVVLVTPLGVGEKLLLRRETARTQQVNYSPTSAFPAADHEEQMNRIVQMVQEIGKDVETAVNETIASGHIADTSGAHAATAISVTPAGNLAATEVQAALNELQADIDTLTVAGEPIASAHISDATDAHAASAITNTPSGNLAASTVQSALDELQGDIDAFAAANSASAVSFTPAGSIAATDVQAALEELDGDITGLVIPSTAADIANVAAGNLVATDVQAALNEIQSELDTATAHIGDATAAHAASAISVSAAGFSGNLSGTDTDVQTALETLDAMSAAVLPSGGTTGQVLAKASNADFDVAWSDDQTGGGGGLTNTTIASATHTLEVGKRHIINYGSGMCDLTLPATSSVGDEIEIVGLSSGSWKILSNASATAQLIVDGTAGSNTSSSSAIELYYGNPSANSSTLRIVCTVANNKWSVMHSVAASCGIITGWTLNTTPTTDYVESTDGNYKILKITKTSASTTLTITAGAGPVQYLVAAGGGGGAGGGAGDSPGGAGGAGGVRKSESGVILGAGTYTITVGAKGTGSGGGSNNNGNNGSASSIVNGTGTSINVSCVGGGGGAAYGSGNGNNGGSGGGESWQGTSNPGTGTSGEGYRGGYSCSWGSGGGGGAGGEGKWDSPDAGNNSGAGGIGLAFTCSGSSNTMTNGTQFYGGGGGGGHYASQPGSAGAGGSSVGGAGGNNGAGSAASDITTHGGGTGSGGGGGGSSGGAEYAGGNGSDGVVILRWRFQ